jgi:phage baseplate assembly protein W
MRPISIEELSLLTGSTRRTIQSRTSALVPLETRPGGATFYDSALALALIFAGQQPTADSGTKTLTAAKIAELESRTNLNLLKAAAEAKTRVPVTTVVEFVEQFIAEISHILRAIPEAQADRLRDEIKTISTRLPLWQNSES